jgi:hypothetical protein
VCGGGEHLVAAGAAGQVSNCGVRRGDIGTEDRPEPPAQIVRQCVATAADWHCSVLALGDIGHDVIVPVSRKKICCDDVL